MTAVLPTSISEQKTVLVFHSLIQKVMACMTRCNYFDTSHVLVNVSELNNLVSIQKKHFTILVKYLSCLEIFLMLDRFFCNVSPIK